MSRQNYVDQYGVRLLDDLHNYFPAVLYDPTQFQTVQDLLTYVRLQTQSRFNPFQSGLREYQATYITHPLPPMPRQPRVNPLQSTRGGRARTSNNNRIVTETYEFIPSLIYPDLEIPLLVPPSASASTSAYASEPIPSLVPASASAPASASSTNLGPARLESTLTNNIFDTALVRALLNLNSYDLESVIVRPTQQQIDRATTLRAATVGDESESCSVCQERYTEGQALRVIHHCHHQFHKDCVDRWFERNVRCPVCRHDVRVPNASSASTTASGSS
jgi:hypothetical protein